MASSSGCQWPRLTTAIAGGGALNEGVGGGAESWTTKAAQEGGRQWVLRWSSRLPDAEDGERRLPSLACAERAPAPAVEGERGRGASARRKNGVCRPPPRRQSEAV